MCRAGSGRMGLRDECQQGRQHHVVLGFDAIGRDCRSPPPANSACSEWRLIRSCMRWSGTPWKRNARGWKYACSRPVAWKRWAPSAAVLPTTSTTYWPASSAIPRWWKSISPPEARTRRNLTAIRRGAERARDLVDQILTFGRRREGRREHVCVKTLVAEAKVAARAVIAGPCRNQGQRDLGNGGRFGRTGAIAAGHPEHLQQCGPGHGQAGCHRNRRSGHARSPNPEAWSDGNQSRPLRRRFDFRSGTGHGRSDTGADIRAVLYHASCRQWSWACDGT